MKKFYVVCVSLLVVVVFQQAAWAVPGLSIEINIPECRLRVYQAGAVYFEAPVGIGRQGHETPVGEFTVINKIVNPTWYPKDKEPVPPGPTNPLGSYWLGLSISGYGLHGNIRPDSIGTPVSLGCVRMHNNDIEYMYQIIDKGTKVTIKYQTIVLTGKGEALSFKILPDVYNYGTTNIATFLELIRGIENKNDIFIPQMINLLNEEREGTYLIPWKVDYYYDGQLYRNVGFRQGKTLYIDPRAIFRMVDREDDLSVFIRQGGSRYISLEELQGKLLHHRVIVESNQRVVQIDPVKI